MDRIRGHRRRMSPGRRTEAALAGAREADFHIKQEMLMPKSGIKWPNLPVTSSKLGEFPAVQSGDLIDALTVKRAGPGAAILEAVNKEGWMMEFGFTTKDGMFHIRPWMRPGIDRYRGEIKDAMKAEMMGI